jgi:dTDP-glucose 4,6-dehydratase
VIIRPFNNYGPRQHLEKVIPRFITSCILGEALTVHGDGSVSRDWVHAEDTAKAVDLAIHAPLNKVIGEVFNAGTGQSLSVLDIAHKVITAFNLDGNKLSFIPDRFGQVQKHIASCEKTKERLGFIAGIDFEEGLKKTIQWYKENRSLWEKQLPLRHVPVKAKDGSVIWY